MLGRRRCRLALGKCVVQEPEERRAGLQWDERDHAHLLDGHFFCFLDELLLEILTCVGDDEAIIMLHQFAFPEKHRWTAEHRPPESESLGKQVLEDIEALLPDLGANENLIVTHVHPLCCWLRTILIVTGQTQSCRGCDLRPWPGSPPWPPPWASPRRSRA